MNSYPPGIYRLSDEEYFALPHISKSGLDLIKRSPLDFKYWKEKGGRQQTKAMLVGTATHVGILEPDRFTQYVPSPDIDRRSNAGKAEYAKWLKDNEGKTPLPIDDYLAIQQMIKAVRAHKSASWILSEGKAEQAVLWHDEEFGIPCKAKVDWLRDDMVVDLKTTDSAREEDFFKSIERYAYEMQLAWYLYGVESISPKEPPRTAVIIAVESRPPYKVATYTLPHVLLEAGRDLFRRNLGVYAECLKADNWPGLSDDFQEIRVPTWYGRAG